jgi:hypothetical protein
MSESEQGRRSEALGFRYDAGGIQARFYHSTFDYIELALRLGGETTWVQTRDDQTGRKLGPERRIAKPSIEHTVYFSSVWCAFPAFIRFLEAITIGIEECAFSWDPEGPDGRMHWRTARRSEGLFRLEWSSQGHEIDYSTRVRTGDLVEALYGAFRNFIESPQYEPFSYERVRDWAAFSLVLADAKLGDFARELSRLPADRAHAAMARAAGVAHDRCVNRERSPKKRYPLEWFLLAEPLLDDWYPPPPATWEGWSEARRRQYLGKSWSGTGSSIWFGSNLRRLRSTRIEEWLSRSIRK